MLTGKPKSKKDMVIPWEDLIKYYNFDIIEMVMEMEKWKPIKGYIGLYEISTYGNVKILERTYKCFNKLTNRMNERVIKERITQGTINKGYRRICLTKNKKEKNIFIHRLVAESFIPNPNNYDFVNHIDGNKQNNCVENLEWCTHSQNDLHAYKNKLRKTKPKREIIQYDLEGNKIAEYESIYEASKKLGLNNGHISRNAYGIGKRVGGYVFKFK